jgi:thiosulfate dehydrogenase
LANAITVDLVQWSAPDISTIEDDTFGKFVKYGARLFTDAATEIGPTASGPKGRFAGNNLSCKNCHLQAGRQPYAMPLVGIWGQFPQYRAREGAIELLQNRINACMERSMPDRAADPHHGAQVYAQYCAACHGTEGLGQRTPGGLGYQFPPLWGPDSFNNGAGMSRLPDGSFLCDAQHAA